MPPPQPPPPLRPSPSLLRQLLGSRALLVLMAMPVGLLVGVLAAQPLAHLFQQRSGDQATALPGAFRGWMNSEGQTLLLLGTDVGGGNTDVIALIKVEEGVTDVVQIPRDSYIEAESYGPIKINSLYALGGIDAVKQEVSARMGRSIQHYMVINLAAIRSLGDMLGGLEINVPKRMEYVDNSQGLNIDLQPGLQTLKGTNLEGFLRFRHDEAGDIGRLERQQLALRALFAKLGFVVAKRVPAFDEVHLVAGPAQGLRERVYDVTARAGYAEVADIADADAEAAAAAEVAAAR